MPAWGQRANRAHLNAIEVFAPFATLVIVAQLAGQANATTAFCAASFFYLRLAHAVVYLAGVPYVRTILFTLAFVAEVVIFWEVIR
ncbi:MAPEG family protein [Bradyrhizobium sp. UFLA05-109]